MDQNLRELEQVIADELLVQRMNAELFANNDDGAIAPENSQPAVIVPGEAQPLAVPVIVSTEEKQAEVAAAPPTPHVENVAVDEVKSLEVTAARLLEDEAVSAPAPVADIIDVDAINSLTVTQLEELKHSIEALVAAAPMDNHVGSNSLPPLDDLMSKTYTPEPAAPVEHLEERNEAATGEARALLG